MYDVEKLPKWAQKYINQKDMEIKDLIKELDSIKHAHSVLIDSDNWFTLRTSSEDEHLWILDKDHPYPVCSFGKGDILLIGRKYKKQDME